MQREYVRKSDCERWKDPSTFDDDDLISDSEFDNGTIGTVRRNIVDPVVRRSQESLHIRRIFEVIKDHGNGYNRNIMEEEFGE